MNCLLSQSAFFGFAKVWRRMAPESSLVKEPTKTKTGIFSDLARAIAASPQGIQSTGLSTKVLRKADFSSAQPVGGIGRGVRPVESNPTSKERRRTVFLGMGLGLHGTGGAWRRGLATPERRVSNPGSGSRPMESERRFARKERVWCYPSQP